MGRRKGRRLASNARGATASVRRLVFRNSRVNSFSCCPGASVLSRPWSAFPQVSRTIHAIAFELQLRCHVDKYGKYFFSLSFQVIGSWRRRLRKRLCCILRQMQPVSAPGVVFRNDCVAAIPGRATGGGGTPVLRSEVPYGKVIYFNSYDDSLVPGRRTRETVLSLFQ